MNIVYLKDSFDPVFLNRDEMQIALQARRHGHEVSIITTDYDLDFKKAKQELNERDKQLKSGITVYRRSGFKLPFVKSIYYRPGIQKLRTNPDIIFVHNIGSFSSFKIPSSGPKRKAKVILKADLDKPTYDHIKRSWLYRSIIMRPVERSDKITCFSEMEKQYLVELGVGPEKITIIPVGIDHKNIPDLTDRPGSLPGKCTIGILGRITEQKGYLTIIEPVKKILKEFPGARFIVSGSTSDKRYSGEFLSAFKGNKQFTHLGNVENIYNGFFSRCDIILLPSLYESGSIICLEAMAAGKAVIASSINPHSEYIKHGKNGLLASGPDDYYKYCKRLLERPEDIKSIGQKARKSVKKYDWKDIGDHLEEIYRKLG